MFFERLEEPAAPAQAPAATEALSGCEVEVLRLIGSGTSNREIASRLYITEGIAKNHISKILRKLGLRNRAQAALDAAERGWTGERPHSGPRSGPHEH